MKVVGLCGGSGSGKGMVSELFLKLNIPSVDTDAVYREMINYDSPCLRALIGEFGKEILKPDGGLDRKKLASIVFSGENSKIRLKKLNEISHKFILEETRKRLFMLSQMGYKAALVDAPVLFESGFNKECDLTLCVIADNEIRIQRIMTRDGLTREASENRINSQLDDSELQKRCDFVITNNTDAESLRIQVEELAKIILEK